MAVLTVWSISGEAIMREKHRTLLICRVFFTLAVKKYS
jgi:hypothetical protein